MNLFLLRHSKSSLIASDINDHDRPLSKEGLIDSSIICKYIIDNNIMFDFILCSSSLRTIETLNSIKINNKKAFKKIKVDPELYLAPETYISKKVIELDYKNILVIGHNPGISRFISILSASDYIDYPPTTFAKFSLVNDSASYNEVVVEFVLTADNGKISYFANFQ
tara:strand:- start:282 stop:782 length:501 start_codon:yes stop_codon:yes gene_type:complete